MKHSIDLHGLPHTVAIIKTEDAVLSASLQIGYTFEIITGNSSLLQDKIVNMLEEYDFDYYIPSHNLGTIIVSDNVIF